MAEKIARQTGIERFSHIIISGQAKLKISQGISPEKLIAAVKKNLIPAIQHTVQLDEGRQRYDFDKIVAEGDAMLADTQVFRSNSNDEFRKRIQSTSSEARCFTLSGPSGSGKASMNSSLTALGIPQIVLFNIRPDRGEDELYGVSYHFVRENPPMDVLGPDGKRVSALYESQKQKRSEILANFNKKQRFISTAGVHSKAGLITQGVPHLLFDLGRSMHDPFVEVDIKHAQNIIESAETDSVANGKINVFSIFVLPPNFSTLAMQLILRSLGENMEESGVSWFHAVFNDDLSVKDAEKLKEFGSYIGQRLFNGITNINDSQKIRPFYVTMDSMHMALEQILDACKFRLPVDAAQAMMQTQLKRVSGLMTVNNYNRLIIAQHRLLGLGIPGMTISIPSEAAATYEQKLKELKKDQRVQMVHFMDAHISSIPLVWSDPTEFYAFTKESREKKPDIAIFPGTFSPFHYGYLTSVMAAMKDFSLNGVILMPGARVSNKFELSFGHRFRMARLASSRFNYISVSPLRQEFNELLKNIDLGGADPEEEQRLRDLGAFSFLVTMNPQANLHYLARVDKVNDFAPSRKNEKSLLFDLLLKNRMPLIWQAKRGVNFELFSLEWERFFKQGLKKSHKAPKVSWLLESEEEITSILREGTTPTFNISTAEKRKKVVNRYPLLDFMEPSVIDYIYRNRLNEAYELETCFQELANEVALALKNGISIDQLKKESDRALLMINEKKKVLYNEGIISDDSRVNMDDLIEEAQRILANTENGSAGE